MTNDILTGQEFIEYMNNSKDNGTIRMNGLAYEYSMKTKHYNRHLTKYN